MCMRGRFPISSGDRGSFPSPHDRRGLVAYSHPWDSVTSKHKRQMPRTPFDHCRQNLARNDLLEESAALEAIGAAVTSETVARLADWVLALEGEISAQPGEVRRAHEDGALCFFYFLYQLIADEEQPRLTHEFLTRTGKWGLIRRRERYGLLAAARAPWCSRISLAASKRVDRLARHLQSVPAASVLSGHGWT